MGDAEVPRLGHLEIREQIPVAAPLNLQGGLANRFLAVLIEEVAQKALLQKGAVAMRVAAEDGCQCQ